MTSIYMCEAYDQISDRKCRYYKDHGGPHRYARLDHDCAVERELRAELDDMIAAKDALETKLRLKIDDLTAARDELADIAASETLDETWDKKQNQRTLKRIEELREV
jgi:hypothetical protein